MRRQGYGARGLRDLCRLLLEHVPVVCLFVRSENGSRLWDKWKLKLPIFGPLVHKICMTRFSRTFAQLIRSGVPILEVMDIEGGLIRHHRIYWGWFGVRMLMESAARKRSGGREEAS